MGIYIGNGNNISKTVIAEKAIVTQKQESKTQNSFLQWLKSILATIIAGVILKFSCWDTIISFFKG
jgi:hypothetical protein